MKGVFCQMDGKRVYIDVTSPLMTFGEILKQAVLKLDLILPTEGTAPQYRLKFKRTILDSSMQIRFATGLAGTVTLDVIIFEQVIMVKDTEILLQNGNTRLRATHPSTRYIHDVLKAFEAASKITEQFTITTSDSIADLIINGRKYGVEEWRGLRVDDVTVPGEGLLIRVCYRKCNDMQLVNDLLEGKPVFIDNSNVESEQAVSVTNDNPTVANQAVAEEPMEVKEDDFEMTPELAKQAFDNAKQKTKSLQDAPLVSKKAVDRKRRADLLSSYPETTVRLLFDGHSMKDQLHTKTFKTDDLGEVLYAYANEFNIPFDTLLITGMHPERRVDPRLPLIDQGIYSKANIWAVKLHDKLTFVKSSRDCCSCG